MRQSALRPPLGSRLPEWLRATLHDRYFWAMLIVALFVNLGLFAFLMLVSPQLPPLVPLHFDATGQPDRIESKDAIFSLPRIGLLMIVGNFVFGAIVYRREPLVTYILGGVAIAVQFLLWFAAILILRVVAG